MARTRLEELSLALPERERKDLLERISRRMQYAEGEETVPVELKEDERERIISHEIQQAGLWVRFLVWLRTFLTGRTRREVFIDIRLRQLKSHIQLLNPGLSGFETRDLTPKFARSLFQVFQRVEPISRLYQKLGSDKTFKGEAFSWFVERRFEHAKSKLEQFVSEEEMETLFAASGQAEDIRKTLAARLNEYVRSVPEVLISQLEDQARLHLTVSRVVFYPFATLFRYFNFVTTDQEEDDGPPVFEHAPAMLTLDLLERLSTAFTHVMTQAPDFACAQEPIAYYLLQQAGLNPWEEPDIAKIEKDLAHLRHDIQALTDEIEHFDRTVPLLDIIRYFRGDPWYQLFSGAPQLHLRTLYSVTLKARVTKELEERLGTVRERVIAKKIHEVLKSAKLVDFVNLHEAPEEALRKEGFPYITCVRSLTVLYNFLLQQFKGVVQEAAQLLSATALTNNRITQNRLAQAVSNLEDLEARIILFDRSLSPVEDDGKQLAHLRANLSSDLLSQKGYRGFVIQKDKEGRDLIDKARENLELVRRVFEEVRLSTFENTRAMLKTLHLYRGRNQPLGLVVATRSEAIGAFLRLLDQLLAIERGD
ncbi:MAG TPA: DUF5312 family protein [Spirochaetia bacterium]|nr:DUF5312 family protein [Spirochaetia bacterium]